MTEPARPSRVAQRIGVAPDAAPWAVRTVVGLASVVIAANVVGGVVVSFLLGALNARAPSGERDVVLMVATLYVLAALAAGTLLGAFVHRRTLAWLLRGHLPTEDEARRAVRTPLDMAVITGGFWLLGAVVIGSLVVGLGAGSSEALEVVSGLVLGGLTTAGVTYALVSRIGRPVTEVALAAHHPGPSLLISVRARLLLLWLLTSGLPVLGMILILSAPQGRSHIRGAGIALGAVALAVGVLSNWLAARAIGAPLRDLAIAVGRVGDGDLDTSVVVDDAGEIGMLQAGVNDMVAGLRERDRLHDLFGRHVGMTVAQQALQQGVTLSGETRHVVALFVDITGSTGLSRRMPPERMVAMLNRFFSVVVQAIEDAGGLVNKFEGDAALCVFGAPMDMPDPASAALGAARRIRDDVLAAGEFDIGIGVAAGQVVAGQIGALSRLEYTVVGDAVNEASRLTDLAKSCPGRVLASGETVEDATDAERRHWFRADTVTLRGRDLPTATYTVPPPPRAPVPVRSAQVWDAGRSEPTPSGQDG